MVIASEYLNTFHRVNAARGSQTCVISSEQDAPFYEL